MAASVSTPKTVTKDVSPQQTAARMTTLLAIAPENMTLAQLRELTDALNHVSGGSDASSATTVGTLLP